jgi:tyrosyl-tRNA synthetase
VELPSDLRQELFQGKGLPAMTAAQLVGFAKSNGEAARLIDGRGLRVNDVIVDRKTMMLIPSDVTSEGVIKLSLGRKRHVLLKPV